jgi:hypothetical protein
LYYHKFTVLNGKKLPKGGIEMFELSENFDNPNICRDVDNVLVEIYEMKYTSLTHIGLAFVLSRLKSRDKLSRNAKLHDVIDSLIRGGAMGRNKKGFFFLTGRGNSS